MSNINLNIVIVNWNVSSLLANCLNSIACEGTLNKEGYIQLEDGTRVRVIVVDNASTDNSVTVLKRDYGWVQLIESSTNLGFTRGNNVALKNTDSEFVMLLNPDTRLSSETLMTLLNHIQANPDIAVVGPKLVYGDGSIQSSRRRFPNLMTALFESTLLEQWFPKNRWTSHYHMADTDDSAVQNCDWVNGACMLVRASAVEELGWLDEAFFMYSEELDWCKRIRKAGWRIVYMPDATVTHFEGQSSGQIVAQRDIYFHSSKVHYFRKHHGPVQAEILRLFLLLTISISWSIEAAKWVAGHKRELRRQRMSAHARVLRSGLRQAGNRLEEQRHG